VKVLKFAFYPVVMVVSFYLGIGWRDLHQFRHTYILNDLIYDGMTPDGMYAMHFLDNGRPFKTRFCSDYLPQWKVPAHIKELVYEDREDANPPCWSIADSKLGYILDRRESDHYHGHGQERPRETTSTGGAAF
jgi:hypothetical protein